jgi:sugar lactone lactonase YvrE
VDFLETRLAPAFDLTIGTGATVGVVHDLAGTFSATAHGANISVSDIRADLLANKDVTIINGNFGTEGGNITWLAGADLDYDGIGAAGLGLTIAAYPSSTTGSVVIGSRIFDSHTVSTDVLNISISALKDLTIESVLNSGAGTVSLAADTTAFGTRDDGVGTLLVGPGSAVTGRTVNLRGAAVNIDTSANPASVTVPQQVSPFGSLYSNPVGVGLDPQGNLFVANLTGNTLTKVTQQRQATPFSSNLPNQVALAVDSVGNIYFADRNGNVYRVVDNGQTVDLIDHGVQNVTALATDAQGNVYVAGDSNTVVKEAFDGRNRTLFATGFDAPNGLAFDTQGNLYVSNFTAGTVTRLTPGGQRTTFASGFSGPAGLAFDALGNLYVANSTAGTVSLVTPAGQVSTFVSGLGNPKGLAVDAQGRLYVADVSNTVIQVSPATLTVRSSLPTLPIAIGGSDNAVAGINLTDAELARITVQGGITIGDSGQTGDISFVTAAFTGTAVIAQQNPTGGGKIVLDDQNGAASALADGAGNITLLAGLGGILATSSSNLTPEIAATGTVLLDTLGPVGSPRNRIQFAAAAPTQIVVGRAFASTGAFLSGLNSLNLGNILVSDTGTADVTARTDISVAPNSTIGAGTISLATDVREDGTGDDGNGTLTIAAGDKVTGTHVTLRGAVVNIDASANPATITGTRQVITFATSVNTPSGAVLDAQGNLYVANDSDNTVSKITPDGRLSVFASGFNNPQGLAFDSAGNLYAANFNSGTVSKVTPQGLVTTYATGFNGPIGLTFDAAGALYVANQNNNTVSKVTPQGLISVFATGLNGPEGLAFDANGNLFVANGNNNTVSKVTPDGKTVTTFASGFNAPFLIAFDANGNLLVANQSGNTVSKVTPGGVVSTFASGFAFPNGVAVDSHGNVFVTNQNNNTVSKVSPDGKTVATFASGTNQAEGVAVDAQGNVYVADPTEGTVDRVSPDGKALTVFASGLQNPTAVAFDAAGNVYIATSGDNTIRKFSPDGKTVTVFTQQVNKPNGLAFDGQGNLFVSNDVNGTGTGSVTKVSPDGKSVTTFLGSFTNPTGLAFDAQGYLYILSQSLGTISKVSPDGKTVTTFAGGFNNPYQIAFDAQGYLYVSSPGQYAVFRISPQGKVSTYASGAPLNAPAGLAFDAQGNLYISNFFGIGALIRVAAGTVTVQSSVPQRPISVGGTANAVTGVNLTDAQLARITASDVLTFGDLNQTGNITLTSATTSTGLVQVLESPTGPGKIWLDETGGSGLTTTNGDARLTAGTGGINQINGSANSFAVDTGSGAVFFNGGGSVGFTEVPLFIRAARLGSGSVAGSLSLNVIGNLLSTGPVKAPFTLLILGGDFTSHAGDFPAGPTDLAFISSSGSGVQHFDSGGQSFNNVSCTVGPVPVQLVNNPVRLTGNLYVASTFDPNGFSVTVAGLTTVAGTYLADAAPQRFLGGLVVTGLFQSGGGPVTVAGVTIAQGSTLVAPSSTLTDTGNFDNEGGIFDPNGGTVVLAGTNQQVNGSNVFHQLTKTATAGDTLTIQAHSTETVTGVLTLQGTNTQPLQLRSSILGQPWTLAPQAGMNLNNLSVQDGTDPFYAADGALYTIQSVPSAADVTVQADVALGKTGVQYSGLIARYSGPGATNLYWGTLVGNNGQFFADIFRNVGGTWTQLAGAAVGTGTGALRFDVLGSSLKVYLNDVLVASATDTALTAGAAGVRFSPNTSLANFGASALSAASLQLPFSDNFNRSDGELGPRWLNRLGESAIQGNQVVTHVADMTSSNPNQLLAIVTLQGLAQAGIAVQADITLGTTGIVYSGLVARYSGPGDTNMYWGGLIGINGSFQAVIYRNVGGVWTQINSATPITLGGATSTLRFEVVGPSLKLFVNGTLATFATDGVLTAAGTVGLRSGNGVAIDNFSASALNLVPSTLPFRDNFNRPDSELGLTWLDRLGDSQVKGNAIVTRVIDPNSQDANKLLAIATVNGVSLADVSLQADLTLGSTGVQYSGLFARYSGPIDQNMYWGGLIGINGVFQAVIYRNLGGVWTQLNAPTPINLTSSTNTVRFDVVGPALKLFVNNSLTTFANDNVLTAAGAVGHRSGLGVTIDNFSATAITPNTVSLPFSDNFNRADGELGLNWLDRFGESQVKGNQVVTRVTDPNSKDLVKLLALATVNGLNAADVTVQSDLTLGTTGITYGGVVARYSGTGDQNMYWAGVIGVNGSYSANLYINVNGTWSLLASTAVGSGNSTITLSVKGTSLTMSFGGKTLTANDSHLATGTVGLRGGPGVTYDNFSAV